MCRYVESDGSISPSLLDKVVDDTKEGLGIKKPHAAFDRKLCLDIDQFSSGSFVTYWSGIPKRGIIRFMQSVIRVPSHLMLPCYETNEYIDLGGKSPRALVSIESLTVKRAQDLTPLELTLDGFHDLSDMIEHMRRNPHYAGLHENSPVSFYLFGDVKFNPSQGELDTFFSRRNSTRV